ncbi:hypothetical protein MKZ38_003496 [Zalerion maritima]|uniref:Uncharacterized protein n=1 Tax=Zalerion maritima TaxID=339359 RepID=A0AAD5S4S3_9PEZI|nr:hypothetical protein MKZ38_003496 [Zalerion maritima]
MDPTSSKQWLMGTDKFEGRMPHHESIQALWETKWKFPVSTKNNDRDGTETGTAAASGAGSSSSSAASSLSLSSGDFRHPAPIPTPTPTPSLSSSVPRPLPETVPSHFDFGGSGSSVVGDKIEDGDSVSTTSFETAGEASCSPTVSDTTDVETVRPNHPRDDATYLFSISSAKSQEEEEYSSLSPCTKSVYPFHDGLFEDFSPVFNSMIASNVPAGGLSPEYTRAFFPTAQKVEEEGDEAMKAGDKEKASDLYLRAACLLRIARFPYITAYPGISDPDKWEAWEWQKKVYMKAAGEWKEPVEEVDVPHVFAGDGDRDKIPIYVRVPAGLGTEKKKCPVVILMTGLDGYRPDNTARCDEFLARGWGSVTVEIPGTADCPANSADPEASERLWDSLLQWMEKDGRFKMSHVMVWGLSSGGYYAVRIAHTHKDKIRGSIGQGAGTHWFFDKDWLKYVDGHEYPFKASPPLAMKHGFTSVEDYLENAKKKFSLLDNGILQKPSTRLLMINGTLDGLMPIEDSMLLFEHGTPKEARFFSGALHMGYPMANSAVYPWMEAVMKGE